MSFVDLMLGRQSLVYARIRKVSYFTYTKANDAHDNHRDNVEPGVLEPLAELGPRAHGVVRRALVIVVFGLGGGGCMCSWAVARFAAEDTHVGGDVGWARRLENLALHEASLMDWARLVNRGRELSTEPGVSMPRAEAIMLQLSWG